MPTKEKVQAVAALTESFKSASGAVLTEYRGLSVGKLQELRRSLGDSANYVVVKNTLTKRALADAGIDAVDEELLSGPTAIAFIEGDPGAIIVFSLPFILIGIGGIALIKKQMAKPYETNDDTPDKSQS